MFRVQGLGYRIRRIEGCLAVVFKVSSKAIYTYIQREYMNHSLNSLKGII